MRSLIRKELRAQLPFLLLIIFLILTDAAEHLFGSFPDAKSLADVLADYVENGAVAGIAYLILAVALALALVPRERDEGTLEFLDALPCTRGQIFTSKAIAGMLIFGFLPLLDNILAMTVHRLGRSSLEPEWPWHIISQKLLIEWGLCFSLLGVAFALSFFRRFAFFILGILIATFMALHAMSVPWIHLLDFTESIRYSFRAGEIAVAWGQLGTSAVVGAVGYLVAWGVFRNQGDRTVRMFGWIERNQLRGPLTALGTILMLLVWLGVGIWYAAAQRSTGEDEEEGEAGTVSYRSWQTSQMQAGAYVFLYPSNLKSRAVALATEAGAVQEKVRGFFNAEPVGEIVADLNSELRHVAGTADWKRINMSIVETSELPEQMAVLGHETTHVYIDSLSDSRLRRAFQYSRWWHEGLATHVEYRLFREQGKIAGIQRVAAAVHRWKASEFESLVDDSAWRVKHDPDLAYSLGEIFFEALVAEHGVDAPGKILRALGRSDAPKDLGGLDLWRDTFQACGWDLSTTVAGYYRRLQELAETEHKQFVNSLPRLRGRVLTERQRVTITIIPSGEVPEGAQLRCRVRRFVDDSDYSFHYLPETGDNQFSIGRKWIGSGEFWYQLGIDHPDAQFTIYEDWQRANAK